MLKHLAHKANVAVRQVIRNHVGVRERDAGIGEDLAIVIDSANDQKVKRAPIAGAVLFLLR
jgi:hypothetical protein